MAAPKWVTIAEYAKLMNYSPSTVNGWIRKGYVKAIRIGPKNLIKDNTLPPTKYRRRKEA